VGGPDGEIASPGDAGLGGLPEEFSVGVSGVVAVVVVVSVVHMLILILIVIFRTGYAGWERIQGQSLVPERALFSKSSRFQGSKFKVLK
jgi:hypothetical protein